MSRKSTHDSKNKPNKKKKTPRGALEKRNIISSAKFFQLFLLWLVPFLVLTSFFFSKVLNKLNFLDFFPNDLIFPILMNAFTALVIAIVVLFVNKPVSLDFKLFIVTIIAFLINNYIDRLAGVSNVLSSVLPIVPAPPMKGVFMSIVLIFSIFFIIILLGRRLENAWWKNTKYRSLNITASIFIVIGFIFLSQTIKIAQFLPEIIRQSSTQYKGFQEFGNTATIEPKPDIYYIVLDRYTNNDVLKEQFDFDNSEFTNYLQSQGFYINEAAYSHYPSTTMSISSTLNAKYTNDAVAKYKNDSVHSASLYHNLVREARVIKALRASGYEYHSIGSAYNNSNKSPRADFDYGGDHILKIMNQQKKLRGIEAQVFNESPYYSFATSELSWLPISIEQRDTVRHANYQIHVLNTLASSPKQGGRFIFTHITIPHEPYYFNADGSISNTPRVDHVGKPIKQKYLGQLEYINNEMKRVISNILERSKGNAVILLNSDEGPYPASLTSSYFDSKGLPLEENNPNMVLWSDDWIKMKYGILQAVRIPNLSSETLSSLSSVNLLRIVLNQYLGYKLEYLPNCNFALTEGRTKEFIYSNITARLQISPDSKCDNYQSLRNR